MRYLIAAAGILSLSAALGCGDPNQSNNDNGASGDDGCSAMFSAIDSSEGAACDGLGSCESIPCVCEDGSTVSSSSCFNGACEGMEACESACGSAGVACMEDENNSSANNTDPNNTNPNNTDPNNTDPNNTNPNNTDPNNTNPNNTDPNNSTTPRQTGDSCPTSDSCGTGTDGCDGCEEGYCLAHNFPQKICTRTCESHADCPTDPNDSEFDRRWRCVALNGMMFCTDTDRL